MRMVALRMMWMLSAPTVMIRVIRMMRMVALWMVWMLSAPTVMIRVIRMMRMVTLSWVLLAFQVFLARTTFVVIAKASATLSGISRHMPRTPGVPHKFMAPTFIWDSRANSRKRVVTMLGMLAIMLLAIINLISKTARKMIVASSQLHHYQ